MTTEIQIPNRDELDAVFRADPYAKGMGVHLEDWGAGWSRVRWTPDSHHDNLAAVTHGGAIFSMADVAFSVASNSWGRRAVALTIDVQYLNVVTSGDELVATARERSRTGRTGAYLIEVQHEDTLVASVHAMVYRLSSWHLGEEAWPQEWRESY